MKTHRVVAAYYPIYPRWDMVCADRKYIGDPVHQFPLLGLYNNTTDEKVIEFDLRAMKNAGVTVVNVHLYGGYDANVALMERINRIALAVGMWWTPTFEDFMGMPVDMSAHVNATIKHFLPVSGFYSAFFRDYDGNYVVFLYLSDIVGSPQSEWARLHAHGIDLVRANSGQVNVYVDDGNCTMGQPCQNTTGDRAISEWFSGPDVVTGKRRVQGFYSWVPIQWAENPNRAQVAATFVRTCVSNGFRPVVSTIPSHNEENWGYSFANIGPNPANCDGAGCLANCGLGGDRRNQPHYNAHRDPSEWSANLDAALGGANDDTWLYIQAYDEWGEGSTFAPNTFDRDLFLSLLKGALYRHGWLDDGSPYVLPPLPGLSSGLGIATT